MYLIASNGGTFAVSKMPILVLVLSVIFTLFTSAQADEFNLQFFHVIDNNSLLVTLNVFFAGGFTDANTSDAVSFVMEKYGTAIAETGDASLAAYVQVRLANPGG